MSMFIKFLSAESHLIKSQLLLTLHCNSNAHLLRHRSVT